jgi:hypothetical protein
VILGGGAAECCLQRRRRSHVSLHERYRAVRVAPDDGPEHVLGILGHVWNLLGDFAAHVQPARPLNEPGGVEQTP